MAGDIAVRLGIAWDVLEHWGQSVLQAIHVFRRRARYGVMSATTSLPSQGQLELLPPSAAGELPVSAQLRTKCIHTRVAGPRTRRRDRVTVDLRGLRSGLELRAIQHQITTATLVRRAVKSMLDEECKSAGQIGIARATAISGRIVKVTVRMDAAQAASLADRARAADLAQGDYLVALLEGMPPAALAPDHAAAVAALVASTDRLAALSTDLTVFMRLLGRASVAQLEPYRASVASLAKDVRQHLATSATLVAELRPARRRP